VTRIGMATLDEDLARQRELVRGRSPPYERALRLLPGVLAGRAGRYVEAAWERRRFFAWYDRPLLLLAALRNDALADGPDHPLFEGFASRDADPAAVTPAALAAALDGSRERVFDALAYRSVQTNETSRAIAWLWPAGLAHAGGEHRPLALADLGASAGLNLVADALPPIWVATDGGPLELAHDVRPVTRLGLDPAPLDVFRPGEARWLRACIWPGERAREERLDAALAAFQAARVRPDAPVLVPVTAASVPARLDLLSGAEMHALVLAYQTVLRDDLEPAERAVYEAGMRGWLAAHPPGRAVWVELEAVLPEGAGAMQGALVAHVRAPWGELRDLELARCTFHPLRLDVRRRAVEELRAHLVGEAHAGVRA
jgi:hypothetical protein